MIVISACFRIETAWIPKLPNGHVMHTPMGEAAVDAVQTGLKGLPPQSPSLIVSTGFCGGLAPSLQPGELVLAETVYHRGEPVPIDRDLFDRAKDALDAAKFSFGSGPILCSERALRTSAEKQQRQTDGAIAVDMESGPLARWARERRIRFLSLRAVLDPLDQDLPFSANRSLFLTMLQHPLAAFTVIKSAVDAGRSIGRGNPAVLSGLDGGRK